MKYRLQCNFCSETFVHIGDAYPDRCPLCGAYIGLDGKPEVALPFLSSKAARSPDDLYRVMEEGAKHRATMAAELTGQPVSDFSNMQQTDMRDGLRQGDTSFVPIKPASGIEGQFGVANGQRVDPNVLAGVRSGPFPNAGAAQISSINDIHRKTSAAMIKSGQVRHKGGTS